MKQKKSGIKLINWHRPLRPSELSKSYRRFRDGESRRSIEHANQRNDDLGDDNSWAFDCWDYEYPVEEIDYLVLAAWNFILQGGIWQYIRSLLSRAEWVAELQKNHVVSAQTSLQTGQTNTEKNKPKVSKRVNLLKTITDFRAGLAADLAEIERTLRTIFPLAQ